MICSKCGRDITNEPQIGAGDGEGSKLQCKSCYAEEKKRAQITIDTDNVTISGKTKQFGVLKG